MTDPLDELEDLLARLPEALREKSLGDALSTAVHSVERAAPGLTKLESIAPVALAVSRSLRPKRALVERLTERLVAVGEKANSADNQEELRDLATRLAGVPEWVGDLGMAVKQAWQEELETDFRGYAGLAEFLERVPDLRPVGVSLGAITKSVLGKAAPFPPDAATLQSVEDARQGVAAACTPLASTSTDLAAFLLQLVGGRATVADLSPDVQRWLVEHGVVHSIGLMLKAT
jgi:hypothetical protein